MIPDPLHPSVIHFPIIFMYLLPLLALWALWAIGRGSPARRARIDKAVFEQVEGG